MAMTVRRIDGAAHPERGDLEERLRAALADAEALAGALAAREEAMAILAHDLRNPLAAVRGLASLLLRRGDLPGSARDAVAEIGRAIARMVELVGAVLDATESRRHGALPVARAAADLGEIARAVVAELRAAHPARDIALAVEGDARGAWDGARLAQVVSNLGANALQHGARDTPVRISVRGDGDEVALEVANAGPAIAPELVPALFQPFRRGPAVRHASRGLGLGLFIVGEVVKAHGGTVAVASTGERGTTFTVRLPRSGARGVSNSLVSSRLGRAAPPLLDV